MLRSFYRCLLRLHPPGFRRRFAKEMLSIFDHTAGKRAAFKLAMDGLLSLARQWTLRPEFWHGISPAFTREPVPDGVPSFYVIDPFRPRTAAVIHGLVLSIAVFCLTCFAIKYSWIHLLHVRIPEVQFDSPQTIQMIHSGLTSPSPENPPAPTYPENQTTVAPPVQSRSTPRVAARPIESTSTSQTSAARSKAKAEADSSQIQKDSRVSGQISRAPAEAQLRLEDYEGTYIATSADRLTISIAVEDGHLVMSVGGQPRRALARVSETKFVARGIKDCWIEFLRNSGTEDDVAIRQLRLFQNGQQFTAQRQ